MVQVSGPNITAADRAAVDAALRDGFVAGGPCVDRFQTGWADYCGRKHGLAVCNGTSALQLALAALRLPAGSRVVMPSFTIMSCAVAALANGLVPVVVDCGRDDWCLDPALAAAAVDRHRAAAVLLVHIYGQPAPIPDVRVPIIEDAAQAHGSVLPSGARCGSVGAISCFSFYANKIITTGEGGMVLTDDPCLAASMASEANLCFGVGADRFKHSGIGSNFRMSNLQAALGLSQLADLENKLIRRRRNRELYVSLLGGKVRMQAASSGSNGWAVGVVPDAPAAQTIEKLRAAGIESRPFFTGLHEQPALAGRIVATPCPVTEELARHGLYLPSGASTSTQDVERVCSALFD